MGNSTNYRNIPGGSQGHHMITSISAFPGDLRDYFAARAMQACFAGAGAHDITNRDGRYDETNWAQVVAANSYEMADAMLTERARHQQEGTIEDVMAQTQAVGLIGGTVDAPPYEDLLLAATALRDLHVSEQEGMEAGRPTRADWLRAVDNLTAAIARFPR